MNPKIIKLYYKKLDKPTNLNGLILHPFLQEDRIVWKYENPNDVSYYTGIVEGHLEGLLYDFLTSIGIDTHPSPSNTKIDWSILSSKYCKLDKSNLHINNDLRNKINSIVDDLNGIKLHDGEDSLNSDCFAKNWSIEYPDSEALYFHLDLELSNPIINNEPVDDDTLQDFIQSFIYCDNSSEQETDFIWEIVKLLHDEKNLYDNDYMYTNAVIGYYDSFGNGLT
jgi:hypothetical protein